MMWRFHSPHARPVAVAPVYPTRIVDGQGRLADGRWGWYCINEHRMHTNCWSEEQARHESHDPKNHTDYCLPISPNDQWSVYLR